jgi:hypothetical protein
MHPKKKRQISRKLATGYKKFARSLKSGRRRILKGVAKVHEGAVKLDKHLSSVNMYYYQDMQQYAQPKRVSDMLGLSEFQKGYGKRKGRKAKKRKR